MSKVIPKLGPCRIYLWSIILLSSIFTSENVFSRAWKKDNMEVNFSEKDGSIIFLFPYYDYLHSIYSPVHSYMEDFELNYCENGADYFNLIKTKTDRQDNSDVKWMKITHINPIGKIEFPNMQRKSSSTSQFVGKSMSIAKYVNGKKTIESRNSYMIIKWILPNSIKSIKSAVYFKYSGTWTVYGKSGISQKVSGFKHVNIVKPRLKTMKNTPSELNSEISDNVKVTGETDAIIATGIEPRDNIELYDVDGRFVKSVMATDHVVNIKVPRNQKYLVKIRNKSYKVAL